MLAPPRSGERRTSGFTTTKTYLFSLGPMDPNPPFTAVGRKSLGAAATHFRFLRTCHLRVGPQFHALKNAGDPDAKQIDFFGELLNEVIETNWHTEAFAPTNGLADRGTTLVALSRDGTQGPGLLPPGSVFRFAGGLSGGLHVSGS